MAKCKTCGDWIFETITHKCLPVFTVWCPEQDANSGDGLVIYACDAEEAAERWAEMDDRNSVEYSIVGQRWTPIVHVAPGKDFAEEPAEFQRFTVTGDPVPTYRAREVRESK